MLSTLSTKESPYSRETLHAYQERAVSFIKDKPSCALWVDMGLGKTVSVLTALRDLFYDFEIGRVLVIAPLRVARHTWPQEIKNWEHTRDLSVRVIEGAPKQRLKILNQDRSDIHVMGRDLVPWLVDALEGKWPYDTVVLDEASSFKSSKTRQFKSLRKVRPHIDRLIALTGTPASNGLLDIWAQVYCLDQGERLGKTFSGFREKYFTGDYHGYNWSLRKGAKDKIYKKLEDVCLTLRAKDYLDLPACVSNTIQVTLPLKAQNQYKGLEKDFLLQLNERDVVVALSAAALTNKLLQCANGAIYTDEDKNWSAIHDAKLEALKDIVAENTGEPLLVAYNYQTDAHRILEAFPQAQRLGQDPATLDRWNEGTIPILLAHPASAGHGLNLQAGGRIAVWFGLNWSLELYQQFNARLNRQGQTKPVIIHRIVAQGTVDETVMRALTNKTKEQNALLDALKEDAGRRAKITRTPYTSGEKDNG